MTFRSDNTEGFSQDELDELNDALETLVSEGWDEKAATDRLNNVWQSSVATSHGLLTAARRYDEDEAAAD